MGSHTEERTVDIVGASKTLFDVLESVKDNDGVTVTEVASELEYATSTVHRHLKTLESLGYIVEKTDGYHLGLRFLDLGQQARYSCPGYELAQEMVAELAAETKERAQFLVEEHGEAVYLCRSVGERAVHTDSGIGSRIPLHATAGGKAILASLPRERVYNITKNSVFDPITDETITDSDTLFEELEQIRNRGYSFNRQENLSGLHAVGVPVHGSDDEVIGALSVSGPSHRLKGELFQDELPDLLLGAANELELNIAYS